MTGAQRNRSVLVKEILKTWLKWLSVAVLGLTISLYVAAIFVPLDPVERQPGIGLSGSVAADQNPDWSTLVEGRTKVWVETRTRYFIPHSIPAMAWTQGDHLYVGCRSCDGKFWSDNVGRDDRVRLKIGNDLYERRAVRLGDTDRRSILRIPVGDPLPDRDVFRMDPR